MLNTGNILAVLGLSALVGGMVFFGAIMAPLVFTKLPPEMSGPFIREAFPRYFAFVVVSAVIAAVGFGLRGQMVSVAVLALIAVAVLWAWLWLIPYLNTVRDAGNMVAFNRGHKISTWLNGAELIASLWLLVRMALLVRPG